MEVIIVCHTEFGEVREGRVIATKDSRTMADSLLNLCSTTSKHGAKVTFAVCPEVARAFSAYLPVSVKDIEVGLHVHPGWQTFRWRQHSWIVGDYRLRQACGLSSDSTVLRDYSYKEQRRMIEVGRNIVAEEIGITPVVFVAGRWSLNNDTIQALVDTEFTHDCSATPRLKAEHFDWSRLARMQSPYRPDASDYQLPGVMPISVLPISQTLKGGNVNPELARIYGVSWLKLAFCEYLARDRPLFHICLHSPCMADDFYVQVLDELLGFIAKRKGVEFKFASEVKV